MERPTFTDLLDDLEAEQDALDAVLSGLDDPTWRAATPAAGWTVAHQVAHLAQGEELAALATTDPSGFADALAGLLDDLDAVEEATSRDAERTPPSELRSRWRRAASATVAALRDRDPEARIAWILGPMAPLTFATARLMETFAHGHDVLTAVGRRPPPTARLVHVADLGVRTRAFSFRGRGMEIPDAPYVELAGPEARRWRWNRPDAASSVRGDALEFCEVVTQRRHVDDTSLETRGPGARAWLEIAQAFAGPPTDGPRPSR